MTKTYTLVVHDHRAEVFADAEDHTARTMRRAMHALRAYEDHEVELHLNDRNDSGWLEHAIIVKRGPGRFLYIAAIQRKPGAESEFCS